MISTLGRAGRDSQVFGAVRYRENTVGGYIVPELTLESLAKRVEALEKRLASGVPSPVKDEWRKIVGNSEDNEFTRLMQAAIEATSEAERRAAQEDVRE
jgi:hypothetical protein